MRSTSPGRLSSSQDLSIGRSISLTRSSRVRALLLSTVLANELKADSTADTVECDRICCCGGAGTLFKRGGSLIGFPGHALAVALLVKSKPASGAVFWDGTDRGARWSRSRHA